MTNLGALADDFNRLKIKARFDGTELTMSLGGDAIHVREDGEHNRLALWGEVASGIGAGFVRAGLLTLNYNNENAYERGMVLAVDKEFDGVVLGRSFDNAGAHPQALLAEAQAFQAVLTSTKSWFAEAMAVFESIEAEQAAPSPEQDGLAIPV